MPETPLDDAVQAVASDSELSGPEKGAIIAGIRATGCIDAFAALIPHVFEVETVAGAVVVTVNAVDDVVCGRSVENGVGVRLSATLDGQPLDIDPDREFLNPPLRFVTPDGPNEETIPARTGPGGVEIPARTYRWREDPVACILQDIAAQIRAEIEARQAG